MIERYYDQCKLAYWLKFFQWRKKYLEMYYDISRANGLYSMLSIDKRKQIMDDANKAIFEGEKFEAEEAEEEKGEAAQAKPNMEEAKKALNALGLDTNKIKEDLSVEKKTKAAQDSDPKPKKKPKSKKTKLNVRAKGEDLEEANIKILQEMQDMMSRQETLQGDEYTIRSLSGNDLTLVRAYLAFPPQMQFVPKPKELQRLIEAATKFRFEKDIPRIFNV